jgi:hypothetical protein
MVVDFPEILPAKATWGLKSNTESFTSPLNSSTQTTSRPGARWKASIQTTPLTSKQAAALDVFLASLEGMAGRFLLWPHTRPGSQGAGIVAARAARTLSISGYLPGAPVFGAGDFIEAGGELKMITSPASANDGGVVTVFVTPPWRKLPLLGATVTATRPKTLMMLDSDEYAITRLPGQIFDSVTIGCIEVFQ